MSVGKAVAILVGVKGICAAADFASVREAVAVRVGDVGVRSPDEDLLPVRQPVAVRVRGGIQPGRVLPANLEGRRSAQDVVRAEEVRDGDAVRDGRAVHIPHRRGQNVRPENGEGVDAIRPDLRAHDEVRRGRVERLLEVIAEDAVARRMHFDLHGETAARKPVHERVLPCEDAPAAGKGVVPEARFFDRINRIDRIVCGWEILIIL